MRRRALTEGTRDEVAAELEQYGSDRAQQGKEDKAREFARALHAIAQGAIEVEVDHAVYRVIGEWRPPQHVTIERDREKVLAELEDGRRARAGLGSLGGLGVFEDAVAAVEAGALAVFVGGVMYRVVEE